MIGALADPNKFENLSEILSDSEIAKSLEGRLEGRIIDSSIGQSGSAKVIKSIQNYRT